MPWPFSTLPQVVGTPVIKPFAMLLYNCNECYCYDSDCKCLICDPSEWVIWPLKFRNTGLEIVLLGNERSSFLLRPRRKKQSTWWCLMTSTWICLTMKWDGTGPMWWLSGQGCLPPRFFQLSGVPKTHMGHGENQHQQLSSDIHTFTLAHTRPDT